MQSINHNYCIILAGGAGTRFWPLSRADKPKQFIDFFGTGRTLLQQTFDRLSKLIPREHIYVTTSKNYVDMVQQQLPELPVEHILPEPAPRNTAPCVAWASSHIKSKDEDANIIVTPCDQMIVNEDEFFDCVRRGLEFVEKSGNILTLGIKPTRAETGFGYIQASDDVVFDEGRILKAKSFTEKPQKEFAEMFFESGEFYWNTGLLLWNVRTIFSAFKRLMPDVSANLEIGMDDTPTHDREKRIIEQNYSSCPNLPIDYGILERADNVYVMPCNFGWTDIGTWETYYATLPKDDHANAVAPGTKVVMGESEGNLVRLSGDKVAIIEGIDDCVVVENDGVIMICRKGNNRATRRLVAEAQEKFGIKN